MRQSRDGGAGLRVKGSDSAVRAIVDSQPARCLACDRSDALRARAETAVEKLETRVLLAERDARRELRETQRMFDRYYAELEARRAMEQRLTALTGRPKAADAAFSSIETFLRSIAGPRCRVCLMGERDHRHNCRLMAALDRIAGYFNAS